MEHSYWLHASLAPLPQKGYWGSTFPPCAAPTEVEIKRAANLLTRHYAANRLYLIYHQEIPMDAAEAVYRWWQRHCPRGTEIVPTLLLRMYDDKQTIVFSPDQVDRLAVFFKRTLGAKYAAIYDIYPKREQGEGQAVLARHFPERLIRVGIQPDEPLLAPYVAAVQDTWSGFCHGKTNADWQDRGFGAETLRSWVELRNRASDPISWDLITVAWDYLVTERGAYPGYDDAEKNMPLPEGRNTLAVREILRHASARQLAGFSSDLYILQMNSQSTAHDGLGGSFYETLKRGAVYNGYYAAPLREIVGLFRRL